MAGAEGGELSPIVLFEVLDEARAVGFLGPGAIEPQVRHAEGFAAVARRLTLDQFHAGAPAASRTHGDASTPSHAAPSVGSHVDVPVGSHVGPSDGSGVDPLGGAIRLVDLGSGGGLPGLVVAFGWPGVEVTLLEANGRRAAFLRRAVERLALADRVSVLEERAEMSGRRQGLRAGFHAALARSFGRPAVVAECAAPLLEVDGWLIVSEPPAGGVDEDREDRWPVEPLRQLGLQSAEVIKGDFQYRTLRQVELCPDRFPRRNGVPAKKPLF